MKRSEKRAKTQNQRKKTTDTMNNELRIYFLKHELIDFRLR